MVPDMTRGARKTRLDAWIAGQELGKTIKQTIDDALSPTASVEVQVEFYRGVGQYFNSLAHDLTLQAQQETT